MKKLTRVEMKNVVGGVGMPDGGGSCSMTYQTSGGTWITEQGSCANYAGWGFVLPFCHTASFSSPVGLSSNGGTSKCGAMMV